MSRQLLNTSPGAAYTPLPAQATSQQVSASPQALNAAATPQADICHQVGHEDEPATRALLAGQEDFKGREDPGNREASTTGAELANSLQALNGSQPHDKLISELPASTEVLAEAQSHSTGRACQEHSIPTDDTHRLISGNRQQSSRATRRSAARAQKLMREAEATAMQGVAQHTLESSGPTSQAPGEVCK